MPWQRGATLEAQIPVAGIAPSNVVTGGGGARGLDVEAGIAASMRRPDIRDDVLGGNQQAR